jgi:iron complex transport system ATP-binding protein
VIELKGLYASYDGAEILHGIDARFPKGKISVLCGPNGCGKSTTVKALLRLVPEVKGTILIEGTPLGSLSQSELARRVAYVPQSRNVPDITVYRLVMHGRFPYLSYPRRYRKEDHAHVREALKWLELEDLADRKLESLSGGQRQKAYMAMALAQDTDVIVLDEPTNFLDIRNQYELLARARAMTELGKTVVMILHDFELILHCADHVVLLGEGLVRASGGAREVLESSEMQRTFGVTPCFYETPDGVHCYVKP